MKPGPAEIEAAFRAHGFANIAYEAAWRDFAPRASLRQLLLFGFPPPH